MKNMKKMKKMSYKSHKSYQVIKVIKWWKLSCHKSFRIWNSERSEKEWWLVTFRLWRCLILKSVQPKETYNTPLLSGPIPTLVLCNQLTKDEADSRGLYNKRKLCAWYFEYKWQKCTWQKGLLCRQRVLRTTCWCERSVKSSLHNSFKCQQADYFAITLSES